MIWTARNRIPKWWNILGRSFCFMEGGCEGQSAQGDFPEEAFRNIKNLFRRC